MEKHRRVHWSSRTLWFHSVKSFWPHSHTDGNTDGSVGLAVDDLRCHDPNVTDMEINLRRVAHASENIYLLMYANHFALWQMRENEMISNRCLLLPKRSFPWCYPSLLIYPYRVTLTIGPQHTSSQAQQTLSYHNEQTLPANVLPFMVKWTLRPDLWPDIPSHTKISLVTFICPFRALLIMLSRLLSHSGSYTNTTRIKNACSTNTSNHPNTP